MELVFAFAIAMSWPASIELSSSILMKRAKCLGSREPLLIFLHYHRLFPSWLWFLICCNLLFVGQSAERPFYLEAHSDYGQRGGRIILKDGCLIRAWIWSQGRTPEKYRPERKPEVGEDLQNLVTCCLVCNIGDLLGKLSVRDWHRSKTLL